jgi:8-oxo-dGTP pyrophosphatase MutT (NUDIX family)
MMQGIPEETESDPWTTLSSQARYDNNWITVTEHQVLTPAQTPGIYGTVHFKNLAIGIVPVDKDGFTWLVGQYRYPLKAYSWEIPEGGGKLSEPPVESAMRELKEETGLHANRWEKILEMHLSNSVTDEQAIVFLATDLTEGTATPDETEVLSIRRVLFGDALQMVERGEITDAVSVAAILKAALLLKDRSEYSLNLER